MRESEGVETEKKMSSYAGLNVKWVFKRML